MEYKTKDTGYEAISPGTIGVAQKISLDYKFGESVKSGEKISKLVFLARNNIIACSHNQF